MKSFTRTLFAVFTASLILVPHVFGQGPDGPPPDDGPGGFGSPGGRNMTPEQMIQRRIEMLDRQLNLTPAQEKKIVEIMKNAQKSAPTGKPSTTVSRRDRLKQAKSTENGRDKVDAEIKKVLTPAQQKKYAEMTKNRGQFDADGRAKRLAERLNLTTQQQQKVRAIYEQQRNEMRKMMPRDGQQIDREKMRAAFEQQRQKTDRQIEAILTPQQKKAYAAMQQERTQRMREQGNGGRSN